MKKLLAITSSLWIAGNILAESSTPALNVEAKVEFNTARVNEGRHILDKHFAPSVEIGFPLFESAGEVYGGVDAYLKVDGAKPGHNEVAPYIGFSYDITDMFTLDAGYTYRRPSRLKFTKFSKKSEDFIDQTIEGIVGGTIDNREEADHPYREMYSSFKLEIDDLTGRLTKKGFHEIYAGIMMDVLLNPALYFSYDFTQRKANIEGSINYVFDLGSFGINGLSIDVGAKLGYSRMRRFYGINHKLPLSDLSPGMVGALWEIKNLVAANVISLEDFKKGMIAFPADILSANWLYFGANADLVYSLNENVKARAGVGFSYNNAKKMSLVNIFDFKKHAVWFSSAIEFTF
ncbi:MAG: hypothetical protein LBB11_01090 [Puniceicoccales bacterium]|nr:hypothetical protein [Puniceicoccales bacterium]